MVEGCIAAGRERGYLHVDWNGDVMPCVFMPHAAANMLQIYQQDGNLMVPCPLRDHYATFRSWTETLEIKPEEGVAPAELMNDFIIVPTMGEVPGVSRLNVG